jgi:hypothetical protein
MKIQVQSYAGHRGQEEPRALPGRTPHRCNGSDRPVAAAPDHRYFKVRAYDGSVYILRLHEATGEWEMT